MPRGCPDSGGPRKQGVAKPRGRAMNPDRVREDDASDDLAGAQTCTSPWDRSDLSDPASADGSVGRLPEPPRRHERDRYEIVGEHARGGLGRVLRAHDRELDRDVAIKELLVSGHTAELRFFREALITAQLEHPSIVPVHEAGRWPDGTPFYSMKLVSGRRLEDLIDAASDLNDRLALIQNVIAVADAISYAHEKGIVHRDLKPANVLVGDFGETVVVDWGLAKSLQYATADEPADEGPFRTPATDGVTVPGGALGTPAFMPPEQFVGRSDRRSDIFALGGILYHALSGKPPRAGTIEEIEPVDVPPLRAPVPRDLAAVASRAMAQDPANRYPSARAFAEDLRRFLRRQPVTARSYSIVERAVLGFVRHRAMATALLGALAVIAVVSTVAAVRTDRQRDRAEQARDELTLKHAELLLKSDPSASAALLDGYGGADRFTRDFLRAEARGRGVASLVAAPHFDTVFFLAARGSEVLSVGEDQAVVKTTERGSETLASDAGRVPAIAYSAEADVLLYAHHGGGVVLRHLDTGAAERRHENVAVRAVALSSDGRRIALAGQAGELAVESLDGSDRRALSAIPGANRVAFAGDSLVVTTGDAVHVADLTGSGRASSFSIAAGHGLAVHDGIALVGSVDGALHRIDVGTATLAAPVPVCEGSVNAVAFVPGRAVAAYACQDGSAGTVDLATSARAASFTTDGPAHVLAVSEDGRFVSSAGQSATVYVHDLDTSFTTRYLGHAAPIRALAATGDPAAPLLSGDVNGAIRVWQLPHPTHRQVMRGKAAIFRAVFSPDGRFLVADGTEGIVRMLDRQRGDVTELTGHTDRVYGIRFAPAAPEFVSWGYDGSVRVWNPLERRSTRVLSGHSGKVEDAEYLDPSSLLTVGVDGRLLAWRPDGSSRELLRVRESLVSLEALPALGSAVVASATGALRLVSSSGQARDLASDGVPITMLKAAGDGRTFATGTARGTVRVYTGAAEPRVLLEATGSIRHLAFSRDGALLAIASEDGKVHLRRTDGAEAPWSEVAIRARYVAFSPAGGLLAITSNDGPVWYYSLETGDWTFTQSHQADTFQGQFSPDGRFFASSDAAGVVVLDDTAQMQPGLPTNKGGGQQ
jgi:eukaryotic-like serine/threonine-protein kinase